MSSLNSVPADTHLSQTQAMQIAWEFCQRIGAPVTEQGTAVFPTPNIGHRETYANSCWQITFGSQSVVEVDDATSVITHYMNTGLSRQLEGQTAGDAMPQENAIQKAKILLQSTGYTNDVTLFLTNLNRPTGNAPPASSHYWSIRWLRQFQGIPFREEGISVVIQAETGTPLSVGTVFLSPPPQSTSLNVTRDQADTIATTFVANAGIQDAQLYATKLEIVRPNTYWQQGGNEEPIPGISRVAYTYFVSGDGEKFYHVYIDAQNGNIIGGGYSELMGIGQFNGR